MSTQYRLVQSGKTASGGCSAGQGSSEPVAPRIYFYLFLLLNVRIDVCHAVPLKSNFIK
jgi:carbohydrate-binding DOMON domain-containing protein